MADTSIHVVYTDLGGEGYLCLFHMVRLAAELLDGELVVIQPGQPALIDKLSGRSEERRVGKECLE